MNKKSQKRNTELDYLDDKYSIEVDVLVLVSLPFSNSLMLEQ